MNKNKKLFRKRIDTSGIRARLAMLVVGCILPTAALVLFLIFDFYEREKAQLTANAISRARAMISIVDRDIAATQSALLALSTSNRLAHGDFAGFHMRAVEALEGLRADSIVVIDKTGQLLLSTRRPYGEPLPKIGNPVLMERMLKTGKPGVSDLFLGPVLGRHIYTIGVPVRYDGSIAFSLNVTVEPRQLMSVLTDQQMSDTWRAAVTDSSGSIVARTHDMEKFFGKKVVPDLLQRMNAANEGGIQTMTLDHIPVLTVYSRSPVTKWAVVIGMPLAEVTAGLRHTLALLIAATLAALVVGFSLAWFLGGRIARSITGLIEPALALGTHESVVIPSLHFKEANELREALLSAGATLRKSHHDAHHDSLTGMPNRALFQILVDQQMSVCSRDGSELAILYIDLDGFKAVNDTHGHAIGDMLLRAVSLRIKSAIRSSDIAARLGGDEFAVALVNSRLIDSTEFAAGLIEIISDPYQLGDIEARVSASIGVAGFPACATVFDTLMKNADHAMYEAKALGKGRACAAMTDANLNRPTYQRSGIREQRTADSSI